MFTVLSSLFVVLGLTAGAVLESTVASAATTAASTTGAHGTTGTTVNPLKYNCGDDAATCGHVGETYGYYQGKNVQLLYSENYYCAPTVSSHDTTTGCEAGKAPASANPTGMSKDGTSLGNTTHAPTLYITVPLFKTAPTTQCTSSATCIDHPTSVDLSALATDLPTKPAPTTLYKAHIPGHDHVVGTRATDKPVWWNVKVIATTTSTTYGTLTSVTAIDAALAAKTAITAPTNVYLFFQVLPGTVPAAQASDLTATAPPGTPQPAAPTATPKVTQREPGQTITNLTNACNYDGADCQTIGATNDWIDGQTVKALYTEQYFCTTTVTAKSKTHCEAGAPAKTVPPGVATATAPTPAQPSNGQIDPLYIPVPLYTTSKPSYLQCAPGSTCIDHPPSIDLSRLASALGVSTAASLDTVTLPGHDHLLTTRNADQPEWWDVIVIPVTSPAGLQSVEHARTYLAVKSMEGVQGSGIGTEVATNVYLWFQTLPGSTTTPLGTTPAPGTSTSSALSSGSGMASMPTGKGYWIVTSTGAVTPHGSASSYGTLAGLHLNAPIVSMASTKDGKGYWLVASDGGVFTFGDATFRGSMGGVHLNMPIVGMAADTATGGYWLVASDGGIFSFTAPFMGSMGGEHLNRPIVGMAATGNGAGYWMVASDGGIFTFGNAGFHGSTGGMHLNKPIVAMAPDPKTGGYWLVASDGGVFSFGVPFYGSEAASPPASGVAGMVVTPAGTGYELVDHAGGAATYGT